MSDPTQTNAGESEQQHDQMSQDQQQKPPSSEGQHHEASGDADRQPGGEVEAKLEAKEGAEHKLGQEDGQEEKKKKKEGESQEGEKGEKQSDHQDQDKTVVQGGEKAVSVGTSTVVNETQEVVSSTTGQATKEQAAGKHSHRSTASARRGSYQASRNYAGSFQNYGLAYLPYKSNFEPSEDARRRADEFLKTLKL